jgi:hypothetical protein
MADLDVALTGAHRFAAGVNPGAGMKPMIGNTPRLTHLIFSQLARSPERYGASRSLLTIPSRPMAHACSKTSAGATSRC